MKLWVHHLVSLGSCVVLGRLRGRSSGTFLSSDGPEPPSPDPGAYSLGLGRKWLQQGLGIWDLGCALPGPAGAGPSLPNVPSRVRIIPGREHRLEPGSRAQRRAGAGTGPPGHFDLNNNKSLALGTVCSDTGGWLGSIPALPPSPTPPPPPHFLLLSLQGSVSGTRLGPMTPAGIP